MSPTTTAPTTNRALLAWVDEGWWSAEDASGKSNFEKVFERWNVWVLGQ